MNNNFVICIYGLTTSKALPVPNHIQDKLVLATTAKEVETVISEHESELAQLFNEYDEFLVCDSAAELMGDVLKSKDIEYKIICGINDVGDSHSYIEVDGQYYDPTKQGFGEGKTLVG